MDKYVNQNNIIRSHNLLSDDTLIKLRASDPNNS